MRLLIVRHAIAEDREAFAAGGFPDFERPVTAAGRKKMIKAAAGLRAVAPQLDHLITSPFTRAAETADIVAKALGLPQPDTSALLTPERHPREFLDWLMAHPLANGVGVVGHEPHLGRLISWCLTGNVDAHFDLKKGGVARIDFPDKLEEGKGVLRWLLTPSQLCKLAG
jgi:phosphohistidine phosphatase